MTETKTKSGRTKAKSPAPARSKAAPGETDVSAGVLHYAAGLDIGNGYVKGVIGPKSDLSGRTPGRDLIDMPSVASTMTHQNLTPTPDGDAPRTVTVNPSDSTEDWYNNVDISISSPLIGDNFRRLIGARGLTTSGVLDQFELVGSLSKAEQDLSKVLVLGIIAAKAVRDYVTTVGALPTPGTVTPAGAEHPAALTVHVTAALALPITEFTHYRDSYAAGFTGGRSATAGPTVHQVTVGNFDTPVTVRIIFDDVVVIAEGASAQYAINSHGEVLMSQLLADVRSRGLELDGITPADLLAARNTIGVDIGEGTVNFPVFTGGKFNAEASATLASGYGTVLENAISAMEAKGIKHSFTGRKQLAEYLQAGPSPLRPGFYDKVAMHVDEAIGFFVDVVAAEFSKVLADVGAMTEVIYVYGGGSGSVREKMADALQLKAAQMSADEPAPVMYLDSTYSRKLNREGLGIAAVLKARS